MQEESSKSFAYTTARSDIVAMVPRTTTRLLDVGCSNGALGLSLKRAIPNLEVVGIEMDNAFAEVAETRLDEVFCADLNTFAWDQLGDRRFDCVVFADVLEHLDDPLRHLLNARALLAPGGCFVISLPNIRHLSALFSIFIHGTFPKRDRGIFDRTHLHWFTSRDATELIEKAGMRVHDTAHTLRLSDQGGGLINRYLNRLPRSFKAAALFREFFTYQFCFLAATGSNPT